MSKSPFRGHGNNNSIWFDQYWQINIRIIVYCASSTFRETGQRLIWLEKGLELKLTDLDYNNNFNIINNILFIIYSNAQAIYLMKSVVWKKQLCFFNQLLMIIASVSKHKCLLYTSPKAAEAISSYEKWSPNVFLEIRVKVWGEAVANKSPMILRND